MKKVILSLIFIATMFKGQSQTTSELSAILAAQSVSASGNITTQNLNPLTGVPTVSSFVMLTLGNQSTATIMVSGTYTGVLSIQFTSNGGTNWLTYTNPNLLTSEAASTKSATIASGSVGAFTFDCAGLTDVRVSALAAVTGTAIVSIKAVTTSQQIGFSEPLPGGSNTIGLINQSGTWTTQMGNTPNTTPILANQLIPVGSLTGDVGAKTVTGNGATITNVNGLGVTVVMNIGAVTGTTPTLNVKLQGSADAGTNWFDIPNAVTGTIISTGIYVIQLYPGLTALAGTGTTGSVAMVNGFLQRTWRIVWTIGGTTPSFTITNIQVNYAL